MRRRVTRTLVVNRRLTAKRLAYLSSMLALALAVAQLTANSEAGLGGTNGEGAQSKSWAVLIGIEGYEKVRPLQHTVNDVLQLSETLRVRAGFERDCIEEITEIAGDETKRPLKKNLLAGLPKWLSQPGPDDSLILYFSGHGIRDRSGKLYLIPLDGDPSDPAGTMIPLDWFRKQLADSKAHNKLLIIDACHAGTDNAEDSITRIPAEQLDRLFKGLARVVTLASSTEAETSQIWPDRRQSLFSYWLNQALKGHADVGLDGNVDIDELYNYVHGHTERTAKLVLKQAQTPVRIIGTGVFGTPVVVRLVPQSLKQLIKDMAAQLAQATEERQFAQAAEERRLPKVGILPEFISQTSTGEFLGADFGLLGKDCAAEIERQLRTLGEGKYEVVDGRSLHSALIAKNFTIEDSGSKASKKGLAESLHGLDALLEGTFRGRTGGVVDIRCKLLRTDGDKVVASVGGAALLNENEWAMIGRSIKYTADVRRPPSQGSADETRPFEDVVIRRLDELAKGPHPLQDPSFPFRLRIMVAGQERQGVFKDNNFYVPLSRGEEYRIDVENLGGRLACMRLLVDGLNTLPEPDVQPANTGQPAPPVPAPPAPAPATPKNAKSVRIMAIGKRMSLNEARFHILDPADSKINSIQGFAVETGDEGGIRTFKVTEAAKGLAARQGFTDQIGLITAAFYEPMGDPGARSRGALGTDLGTFRKLTIKERDDVKIGKPIAVVHIRYVDPEELKNLGQ